MLYNMLNPEYQQWKQIKPNYIKQKNLTTKNTIAYIITKILVIWVITPISRTCVFQWRHRWLFHTVQLSVRSISFYVSVVKYRSLTSDCYAQFAGWKSFRSDAYLLALLWRNSPSHSWLSFRYEKAWAMPALHGRFHQYGDQRCRPEHHLFWCYRHIRASVAELCYLIKLYCSSSSQISATSARTTGEDVIRSVRVF